MALIPDYQMRTLQLIYFLSTTTDSETKPENRMKKAVNSQKLLPTVIDEALSGLESRVTEDMNQKLLEEPTSEEGRRAE